MTFYADRAADDWRLTARPASTSRPMTIVASIRDDAVEQGMMLKSPAPRCRFETSYAARAVSATALQAANGMWQPAWLIERRRIGPMIRALQLHTNPLFRRAGLNLGHE